MNERIQQLIAQSTVVGGALGVEIFDREHFAHLIVEECAQLCRDRRLTPSAFTADELLEHFGVLK